MAIKENPYFEIPTKIEDIKVYDYEMTEFEDEIVENPWTFKRVNRGESQDGHPIDTLVPAFGEVINEGVNLSQKTLGNLDVGIYLLYKWKEFINATILSLQLKGDASDGAILNGFLAVQFVSAFNKLGGEMIILDGYLDEDRGELSV